MNQEEYIASRLDDQINWYDKKSIESQKWFKRLRVAEIVLTSLIPIMAMLSNGSYVVKIITALAGAIVAIIIAVQGLNKFHENWIQYRMIAETLKHEKFLYLTKTDVYSEDSAFNNLVKRVESIISHENLNWSDFNKVSSKKKDQ